MGWNLEDLAHGCQVRMDGSSQAWVEARSGSYGPGTEHRRLKKSGSLEFIINFIFLWVEHVWSSGRVRRQRHVNKLNMSEMIRVWSERGKCDGEGENIKGNALVPDFAQNLSLAYPILMIGGDELAKFRFK